MHPEKTAEALLGCFILIAGVAVIAILVGMTVMIWKSILS